jgi:adenylate kinase family enzyme
VIFISGSPGSGKRTQCKKIVEQYGFKFISCGNLLRSEAQKGGEVGDKIKAL